MVVLTFSHCQLEKLMQKYLQKFIMQRLAFGEGQPQIPIQAGIWVSGRLVCRKILGKFPGSSQWAINMPSWQRADGILGCIRQKFPSRWSEVILVLPLVLQKLICMLGPVLGSPVKDKQEWALQQIREGAQSRLGFSIPWGEAGRSGTLQHGPEKIFWNYIHVYKYLMVLVEKRDPDSSHWWQDKKQWTQNWKTGNIIEK